MPSTASDRIVPPRVALETTLLLHGVPRASAKSLAQTLDATIRSEGAEPALVALISGVGRVGITEDELDMLLALPGGSVRKINSANLGVTMARRQHGATTVSSTMELAAGAGVSVFATGGIGGVHPLTMAGTLGASGGSSMALDISSDLTAFTRFPVAVVTSGVKSILDVAATREVLETLGVPVVGYQAREFPAFYLRESPHQRVAPVDERFESIDELAAFVRHELARTARGVVVCNPIPVQDEISRSDWARWLRDAQQLAGAGSILGGRDVTPSLLAALHEVSDGATLKANIALAVNNARVGAMLARAMRAG